MKKRVFYRAFCPGILHTVFLSSILATALKVSATGPEELIWEAMEAPTDAQLSAIRAFDSRNVIAVGHNSTVIKFDGYEWRPFGGMIEDTPPIPFDADTESGGWGLDSVVRSIGGLAADDFWIGGYDLPTRSVSRWNGSIWSPRERGGPNDDRIFQIWAGAPNLVICSRSNGRVTVFDGEKWTRMLNFPDGGFSSVDGVYNGEIWAVGTATDMNVAISTDNGNTWFARDEGFPLESVKTNVSTLDNEHTWILCYKGIVFWNGQEYRTQYEHEGSANLRAIKAVAPDNVWVVGDYNIVLHFDGVEWSRVAHGAQLPGKHLTDLTVDHRGQVYAVGYDGSILRGRLPAGTTLLIR